MKKKIIIITGIIILLIIGIIIYSSLSYDMYETPEEVIIELNNNEFNIYENHTSKELIKNINADILSEEITLPNDTLGKYTYTLTYMYQKRKYKYDITYKIIDKEKPIFISAPTTLTMEASDNKDVCQKIIYADNYDNLPTCKINGTYDKTKIGTYQNLEYVITDKSNNEISKKFTLVIVDKIKKNVSSTTPKYLYIDDIINTYKNDDTEIGIDVSKWQGQVDFQKVKDAGIEFVIMRIGSSRSPGDDITMDIRFKEYYEACKKLGLKVGVYIYNVAISNEQGLATAKWVLNELNGDKLDLPIAYDFEAWQDFMDYKISLHTLISAYKTFEKELNDHGYETMLYSSKYYLENVWTEYENTNIWLAHYTSKTDYKGNYMLWQMTSSAKINGITENTVDVDILYKNKK